MGGKSKYTIDQKVKTILDYKSGRRAQTQICIDFGLNTSGTILHKWVHIYDEYGKVGLLPKPRNKNYTKKLKKAAINDYSSGKGSYQDIVIKYLHHIKNLQNKSRHIFNQFIIHS